MPKVIARVNDPRNQAHFDLLGISPTVSRDLEHHGADRARGARARPRPPARAAQGEPRDRRGADRRGLAGRRQARREARAARGLAPDLRSCATASSEIAVGSTELQPGDQVLAILQPGKEDELRRVLLKTLMRSLGVIAGAAGGSAAARGCRRAGQQPQLRMRPFASAARLAGLRHARRAASREASTSSSSRA